VWTKDKIQIRNANVKPYNVASKAANALSIFQEEDNPYGRIPFEILYLHGGRLDLSEGQLTANTQKFQGLINQSYNSNPIGVSYNIPENKISVSPGSLVAMDGVPSDGELLQPQIAFFKPDSEYDCINEFRNELLYETQRNEDIPNSVVTGDATVQSGTAKLVEYAGLIERATEDEPILAEFEERLAILVQIVSNVDADMNLPDINFDITYPPETVKMDPLEEYEFAKLKYEDGTMDPYEFYKAYGGIKDSMDDEEIVKIINQRRTNKELLELTATNEEETEDVD
jgi:hypothetical protein